LIQSRSGVNSSKHRDKHSGNPEHKAQDNDNRTLSFEFLHDIIQQLKAYQTANTAPHADPQSIFQIQQIIDQIDSEGSSSGENDHKHASRATDTRR
jgi:hypothetical protein